MYSHLITHISVPLDATDIILDLLIDGARREVPVDRQQLGVILDLAAHLVNVQGPKVRAELSLPILTDVREVLILEDEDAALGGQQRQLVALRAGQRAQLQPADFGPDRRRDLVEGSARGAQESFLFRVGS